MNYDLKLTSEMLTHFINPTAVDSDYQVNFEKFINGIRRPVENGELFEAFFMNALGIQYNTNLTGTDGFLDAGGLVLEIEAKRESPGPNNNLEGKSQWSIHTQENLDSKSSNPNFYLLQFGFKDGVLVYSLLIRIIDTKILKGKKPKSGRKMSAGWMDFKDGSDINLLYINRDLVKKHCVSGFKNWLLSKRENVEEIFGVNLREMVGLPADQPEVYWNPKSGISLTPEFWTQSKWVATLTDKDILTVKRIISRMNEGDKEEVKLSGFSLNHIIKKHNGIVYLRSPSATKKPSYNWVEFDPKEVGWNI